MTVYVFGNPDVGYDLAAYKAAKDLADKLPEIKFEFIQPNADINFNEKCPVIMDTVMGIKKVTVIEDFEYLVMPPRNSTHDFDLGFQLKYLKKLGRIKKAVIVGIPMQGKVNYLRIQSILRKLVAQDIQGS